MSNREPRGRRPRLEPLERRDCPAGTFNFLAGTLYLYGDPGANAITITDNHSSNRLSATIDGVTRTFSNVQAVVISTGNGDDTVNYSIINASTRARSIAIDLGDGNDIANFVAEGGVGTRASLTYSAFGGNGNDIMSCVINGVSTAAFASVALDGGNGNDTLGAVAAGRLAGRLGVGIDGGDGNDALTATMNLNSGSTGSLGVAVRGGRGNDNLALLLSPGANAVTSLTAEIDGGQGTDRCTRTGSRVRVVNCEL